MFGKPYFDLARAIYRSSTYEELIELLVTRLPAMIGAEEVLVMQVSPVDDVFDVTNHGPLARRIGANLDAVNLHNPRHPITGKVNFSNPGELGFAMSDYITREEYHSSAFVKAVFGPMAMDDVLFGMIVEGEFRKAYLNCYRRGGPFEEAERERFNGILLIARGVLDRLELANMDRMVQRRVFMSRSGTMAVLILRPNGEVVPLNHAAVQLAESWWKPDEPVRQLSEVTRQEVFDLLASQASWTNPVSAAWLELSLDLGGGEKKIFALPKQNGEAILMMPGAEPPSGDGEDNVVGILTRRQREIMDWIAEGKTSAEAAIILSISPRTVEKHLEAVFQRMGVENRIAAVRRYLDLKRGL